VENFHQFYQGFWADRWPEIFKALKRTPRKFAFFIHEAALSERASAPESQVEQSELPPRCYNFSAAFTKIGRSHKGGLTHYVLDPASWLVGFLNRGRFGERVLDLCAAPGGKAVVAIAFSHPSAEFTLNERSRERFFRLRKVIQEYFPEASQKVRFFQRPGGIFGKTQAEQFDRVLVDAPCSGERFLIANPREMAMWKPSRSKRSAQEQYALVTAAFLTLKPGGVLIYSTCSLSALENDGVVERLIDRFEGRIEVTEDLDQALGERGWTCFDPIEKTSKGWIFLPDTSGFGPLYFSVIRKSIES
jgi:16S rRNA C967 or C1407 C5-methylase (RsmB/RsmF family)